MVFFVRVGAMKVQIKKWLFFVVWVLLCIPGVMHLMQYFSM